MKTPLIPDGKISRAIREGLALRKQLIADGTSEADADRIVGAGLKGAWQDSTKSDRTEPWHYLCQKCKDTGWEVVRPTYVEQQRLERLYGPDSSHQGYVAKCEPCLFTDRERDKRRQTSNTVTGLAAVGQMKPRRKW